MNSSFDLFAIWIGTYRDVFPTGIHFFSLFFSYLPRNRVHDIEIWNLSIANIAIPNSNVCICIRIIKFAVCLFTTVMTRNFSPLLCVNLFPLNVLFFVELHYRTASFVSMYFYSFAHDWCRHHLRSRRISFHMHCSYVCWHDRKRMSFAFEYEKKNFFRLFSQRER